jgi:hypothetical protein
MEHVSAKMMSIVVSVLSSAITLNTFYNYSSQKELWLAILLVLVLYIIVLQRMIGKCCYSRAEEHDIDKQTLFRFTETLHMTTTIVLVKLVMDVFSYLIAITPMEWYDYLILLFIVVFFVMVIFARLDF